MSRQESDRVRDPMGKRTLNSSKKAVLSANAQSRLHSISVGLNAGLGSILPTLDPNPPRSREALIPPLVLVRGHACGTVRKTALVDAAVPDQKPDCCSGG